MEQDPKKKKVDKTEQKAPKSLNKKQEENNKIEKPVQVKNLEKTQKSKDLELAKQEEKVKRIKTDREQNLEGIQNAKKSNKRALVVIIALVLLILIIGITIAIILLTKPKAVEAKNVVANVEVLSYKVQGETSYALGRDVFEFTEDMPSTTKYSQGMDVAIDPTSFAQLQYVIDNQTGNEYIYTLSFEEFVATNCVVRCYSNIEGSDPVTITNDNRVVSLQYDKDIALTIEIRMIEDADMVFEGGINLTLSVV